ncbi:MAG TPA: hypothetical protein V6D17_06120, partial [Candidatus Obscuribacterales bacterium]
MRCPECDIRNSVAARNCKECGYKFKQKPLPVALIAGAAGVVVVVILGIWLIAQAFTQSDPQVALQTVAKRVARGPKTPEEAAAMRADLDKSIKDFLRRFGTKAPDALIAQMQTALPSSAFEVHVFELPRGLKIVEVDTVLLASEYLVFTTGTQAKAVSLPGAEVFDGARVINDKTGPVLVVVGHTSGPSGRRPQVKVYSLMPDDIHDQSEKSVPPYKGEGTAAFSANDKDIIMDVSLHSMGVADNVFLPLPREGSSIDDEVIRSLFVWDKGRFTVRQDKPKSQLAALYAVTQYLKSAEQGASFKEYLSPSAVKQIDDARTKIGPSIPGFTIVALKSSGSG